MAIRKDLIKSHPLSGAHYRIATREDPAAAKAFAQRLAVGHWNGAKSCRSRLLPDLARAAWPECVCSRMPPRTWAQLMPSSPAYVEQLARGLRTSRPHLVHDAATGVALAADRDQLARLRLDPIRCVERHHGRMAVIGAREDAMPMETSMKLKNQRQPMWAPLAKCFSAARSALSARLYSIPHPASGARDCRSTAGATGA